MASTIIRKILSLLFLFVFLGLIACNIDVVKENGEEKEEKPDKEENVVNVEEAEKLFIDYSAELYTIKDPSNPPTFDEIAENIKVYLTEEQYDAEIANRNFKYQNWYPNKLKKVLKYKM